MRIDTHAHLWPTQYLDLIESAGQNSTGVARNMGATECDHDLAARFRMMDQAGVAKQILSATPQILQCADEQQALEASVFINDFYAETIARHPGRFLAYGAVPLPHVGAAIMEARRAIKHLGFLGVAVNTVINDTSIASDDFLDFYAELNELGATLYIHPTGCGAHSPMICDFNLQWVIGAPYEDTIAILQLLKADIPHKFPRIKFHVAHLGGNFAFSMQRIEDSFEKWRSFPRSPREQMSKMWFDAANFHAPALRCMVETVGHERIMLGTDFPYIQDEHYVRAVTHVQNSGLPDDVIQAILETNAERLFNLG